MSVGQSLDREAVLNDIQCITGKRPQSNRYDERKWSIVLPAELTRAITALAGVVTGGASISPPPFPPLWRTSIAQSHSFANSWAASSEPTAMRPF